MKTQLSQIALFGTSADPPTNGHLALLKGLLEIFPMVITWASDNPIKIHGASLDKRYELLNTLVQDISNPNLKLVQELSSPWTIETLKRAIEINAGFSILPETHVQREVAAGTLKTVQIHPSSLTRPIGIIHRENIKLGENTESFIELLMDDAHPRAHSCPSQSSIQQSDLDSQSKIVPSAK